MEQNVERVIFASSAAVYGSSKKETKKVGEEGPPSSPYAESKLLGEEFARQMSSGDTTFVCLRFFNVYGPYQKIGGSYSAAIPSFIHSAINDKEIQVYGDGGQTRDFIHVSDVCAAIISSLSTPLSSFSVINVGSGNGISILEIANKISELVESIVGSRAEVTFAPKRIGDVRDSTADISDLNLLFALIPPTLAAHITIAAGLVFLRKLKTFA